MHRLVCICLACAETYSYSWFLGSWPVAILLVGNGLHVTLLSVRADLEGFSATLTGLVMSTFYLGFLFGSILTPKITIRVGHIRVFAAFAALSSAAILVLYMWRYNSPHMLSLSGSSFGKCTKQ